MFDVLPNRTIPNRSFVITKATWLRLELSRTANTFCKRTELHVGKKPNYFDPDRRNALSRLEAGLLHEPRLRQQEYYEHSTEYVRKKEGRKVCGNTE